MGITKTQIFDEKQNELARVFKALGHPARVAILQYISAQEGCICNDIVEEVGLAQATVSQHLSELKKLGIISGEIEGKSICYCVDVDRLNQCRRLLNDFFVKAQVSCCK